MKNKQFLSLLLSSVLVISALNTPFTIASARAAEDGSLPIETVLEEPDETEEPEEKQDEETEPETKPEADPVTDIDDSSEENETQEEIVENSDESPAEQETSQSEESEETDESEQFVFTGTVTATTKGQEVIPGYSDGQSPDDLFAVYVENNFNGRSSAKRRGAKSASGNLSGIDRAIYDNIASVLPEIAAGERASTTFEISTEDLGLEQTCWTAEELGVPSIWVLDESGNIIIQDDGSAIISDDAYGAVEEKTSFDLGRVVSALLADYPYHLYWYEKTQNTSMDGLWISAYYDPSKQDYVIGIDGSIVISFPVAEEYSAGDYTVDTSIGQSVQSSVANANAIVDRYSGASDYDKLRGYLDEICELVSYNDAAAAGGFSYGNP